jgi:hypothetical protein
MFLIVVDSGFIGCFCKDIKSVKGIASLSVNQTVEDSQDYFSGYMFGDYLSGNSTGSMLE